VSTIIVTAVMCVAWVLSATSISGGQTDAVLLTRVEGPITPVIADHIGDGVTRAESEGYAALVVELDTPGGLDASMRQIVQAVFTARVPVIVYVAPSGARAASAGAIITLSSHIAAMAPGTAIGAATPVDLQGDDISQKIINDTAAYVESIAETRDRNVEFAIDAVREGRSATAREAVDIGAVDVLASSRTELLETIDGTRVTLASGGEAIVRTRGAGIVVLALTPLRQLLQWIADPNLAFLFMSLGTLAILYELANPGVGLGGIVGAILLVLALAALSVLPVNAVGVILAVLAAGLLVAELFAPGIGVFAVGATVALVLGGAFLFRGGVEVSPLVLLPTGAVVGGGAVLAGRLIARSRQRRSTAGRDAVIGEVATVRLAHGGSGQVTVGGVWWQARSNARPLRNGERVRVVDMEGLDLVVEPEEERQ
jgi:membrane-bound serine protease (ClpP class)